MTFTLSRIDKLEAREKYLEITANLHIGNMLITVCNKYLTKDTSDSATNKGASNHSTNRAIQRGRDAKKKDLPRFHTLYRIGEFGEDQE